MVAPLILHEGLAEDAHSPPAADTPAVRGCCQLSGFPAPVTVGIQPRLGGAGSMGTEGRMWHQIRLPGEVWDRWEGR